MIGLEPRIIDQPVLEKIQVGELQWSSCAHRGEIESLHVAMFLDSNCPAIMFFPSDQSKSEMFQM